MVTLSNSQVGATTIYSFEFALSNPVPVGGVLAIHFPPSVSVTSRSVG